jgi:hypothetical protein
MTEDVEQDVIKFMDAARANVFSSYLTEDTAIKDGNKTVSNRFLSDVIEESTLSNYRSVVDSIFTEEVTNYDTHYTSPENAVMQMFEDDTFSEAVQQLWISVTMNTFIVENQIDLLQVW